MSDRVHHVEATFSGRVQGVGFRYQTREIALEFAVTGYVQNLPDGRVRLEAEGESAEVRAFVAAVRERLHGFIRDAEVREDDRPPVFGDFRIVR